VEEVVGVSGRLGEQELAEAITEVDGRSVLSCLRAPLRSWAGITFHHSFAPHLPTWGVNYAVSFNRFHKRHRGWDLGLGYHLLVSWDPADDARSVCWASYRWVHQTDGAHARNAYGLRDRGETIVPNRQTIGVCIVGDLSHVSLPEAVYEAVAGVVRPVVTRLGAGGNLRLFQHDQFQEKNCPGARFSLARMSSLLGIPPASAPRS
jgi:hypothetical protein